jgi:hypothetical protein
MKQSRIHRRASLVLTRVQCFDTLMAPACANCGQPVLDKAIRALGKTYHPEHFTCSGCGTDLAGKKYKEDEGEPFCLSCKELAKKRMAPESGICALCKQKIFGDFITLRGQRMHPHHFQCEEVRIHANTHTHTHTHKSAFTQTQVSYISVRRCIPRR